MRESLGRRLERERERRGISLASIAEETKISRALLEGLERDDLSHWPPGIFRRSFVRSYATAIGIDAEAVVSEFLEWFPETDNASVSKTRAIDQLLTPASLRLTLADEGSRLSGLSLVSQIRYSLKGAVCDLATVLTAGALGFLALGEFWMALAAASLVYYAGGTLLFGNTPGMILFEPKVSSRTRGHLRLLVGNAAPVPDASQESAHSEGEEDTSFDLALQLDANESSAEPTRRAVG